MASNSDYVTALYRALLDREPDEEGFEVNVGVLDRGKLDRRALLNVFLSSEEYAGGPGASTNSMISWCFGLAFGRFPTADEVQRVEAVAHHLGAKRDREYLRATLAAFDRHAYPTPVAVRFVEDDLVTASVAGSPHTLTVDAADLSVSDQIIHTGSYEDHIARVLPLFVQPGMTAVDVGANVGFHTLRLSELVGDAGTVYAFEPNTENVRMLLLTKARCGLRNVQVLPLAVSDRVGSAFFSPAIGSNGGFMADDVSTLLHPNCMVIPTVRLDDIIDPHRLDFIKIDVEGAEHLVVQGAQSLLRRHKPVVISEFSLEMTERVSKVQGAGYLNAMVTLGYRIYSLGMSGPVTVVDDVVSFLDQWGDRVRIEDLAFVPPERGIELGEIERRLTAT